MLKHFVSSFVFSRYYKPNFNDDHRGNANHDDNDGYFYDDENDQKNMPSSLIIVTDVIVNATDFIISIME